MKFIHLHFQSEIVTDWLRKDKKECAQNILNSDRFAHNQASQSAFEWQAQCWIQSNKCEFYLCLYLWIWENDSTVFGSLSVSHICHSVLFPFSALSLVFVQCPQSPLLVRTGHKYLCLSLSLLGHQSYWLLCNSILFSAVIYASIYLTIWLKGDISQFIQLLFHVITSTKLCHVIFHAFVFLSKIFVCVDVWILPFKILVSLKMFM